MSTKNTTGDKLIASIRKTKNEKVPAPEVKTTEKTKVTKATAPRKKTASVKKAKSSKKPQAVKKQLVDLFQSGERVWPD